MPAVDQPTFVPSELSMTIDTRNFREHPTSGLLLRGAAAHYDDRDTGAFTHQRYEGELAGFIPMAGERVVLALHGWVVNTPRDDDNVGALLHAAEPWRRATRCARLPTTVSTTATCWWPTPSCASR